MAIDISAPLRGGAPVRGEPIAVELMNTLWADREGVHDALGTPAEAASWLQQVEDRLPRVRPSRGTVRANLTGAETEQLRALRDAVRRVAVAVVGDPRPAVPSAAGRAVSIVDALAIVNGAAASLPPQQLRRVDGVVVADRRAADPFRARISGFAVDAIPLLAGDHPGGVLRACVAPSCVLFFAQDHARREWCSPACGNRARVARHYSRNHSAARGVSPS